MLLLLFASDGGGGSSGIPQGSLAGAIYQSLSPSLYGAFGVDDDEE